MSTAEIKIEIQQVLDSVPEDALVNILDYLKQFQNQTQDQIELAGYIKKIITEDKNLLERLAK
ncbi:MAG: hypothetical protein ABIN91_03525 [Mucilaginibacter sp.]|uniref:hypothetical protein n=1 Tax=Mucilaginibacter sp. TaxID=1882438 RepID=UPI003266C08F